MSVAVRRRGDAENTPALPALEIQAAAGVKLPTRTKSFLSACLPGVAAAWKHRPESAELIVRFISDRDIRRFNLQFKGRDYATDVLAFVTGDVLVSAVTARRQAREIGHSFRRELVHLAVHGLLHLGGWDDATPALRERMERRTVAILDVAEVS